MHVQFAVCIYDKAHFLKRGMVSPVTYVSPYKVRTFGGKLAGLGVPGILARVHIARRKQANFNLMLLVVQVPPIAFIASVLLLLGIVINQNGM